VEDTEPGERKRARSKERIEGRGRQNLMLQFQSISPMRRAYWVNFLDVDSSQTHPRGDCGAAVVDSIWRTPDISDVDVDTRETQKQLVGSLL
jgi:hypothetical protein